MLLFSIVTVVVIGGADFAVGTFTGVGVEGPAIGPKEAVGAVEGTSGLVLLADAPRCLR